MRSIARAINCSRLVLLALLVAGVVAACGGSSGSSSSPGPSTPLPPDTAPPQLISTSPVAGATGVAGDIVVVANFSESLNPATVNTSTFSLRDSSAAVITGSVSLAANSAQFHPTNALTAGVAYTARVTTGIRDLAGNALASDFSWTFTIETVPPQVVQTTPANGAISIATDTGIRGSFSESLDPASVSAATFRLRDGASNTIVGTVALAGNTATLQPSSSLASATTYTATLTTGIRDLAGNPLASDFSWTFATEIDAWQATSTTVAPALRADHTAVWTGTQMIVWGGSGSLGLINTGGRYTPSSNSWSATNTSGAPAPRNHHTTIWTGSEMIVWGGDTDLGYTNAGGRYTPSSNSWNATNASGPPLGRSGHTAVWTGSQMIVWGGDTDLGRTNTGGRYTPSSNSWSATTMSTNGAPSPRIGHTAVWNGAEMIVWGGIDELGNFVNTGARYNPATNTWSAMTTANAPTGRRGHVAIWTGTEMIVWSGLGLTGSVTTGARYNPAANSWQALTLTDSPAPRTIATAVWTDAQMIVWGGDGVGGPLSNGGRYDPTLNRWRTISNVGAPGARTRHTAVWSGSEAIIWGGNTSSGFTDSGGRYDP